MGKRPVRIHSESYLRESFDSFMSSRRRSKFTAAESEKHFVDMAEWIAMESKAEIQRMEERRKVQDTEDAEKSGETILDLVVTDHVHGLGGHQLVTFKTTQ